LLDYVKENTPTARLRRSDAPPQLKQITQSNAVNELLMSDPDIFKKNVDEDDGKKKKKDKTKKKSAKIDPDEIVN